MSVSLPRRRFLTKGAGLATTAVVAATLIRSAHNHQQGSAGTAVGSTVVRWDARLHKWAARPAQADFGVIFLSTNDPAATPPTDPSVQAGDVWRRHPDAVAT
jgi:hypothetical protein